LAGGREELHLEPALGVDVNDCADVAEAQSVLGDVTSEDDFFVELDGHQSGYAVMKRGWSSPASTIQTVRMRARRPAGPVIVARISYFVPNSLCCPGVVMPVRATSSRTARSACQL